MRMPLRIVWLGLGLCHAFTPHTAQATEHVQPLDEAPPSVCECAHAAETVARAQTVFDGRGAAAALPLTPAADAAFAAHVNEAYGLAACVLACDDVPEPARDQARRILAATAYKSRDVGVSEREIRHRLTQAERAMEACLARAPTDPECLTWHASARGRLAQYSWSPLLIALPRALLAEFRAARGTLAPGRDLRDGAATRGEASLLMRAPGLLGGDLDAARTLMEAAAGAPRFRCSVTNRMLLAETRTRTGDAAGGLAEIRATVAAGLPDCARQRYENLSALDEATRCLQRIEADPTLTDRWPDECP